MMVILHVLIALSSIAFTTYAYFRPSTPKLRVGYGLTGLTLATGIYLVWSAPAHMIEACTMGLFYLGVVTLGIVATRSKLAARAENSL
jgi:hypothetical protein